MTSKAAPAQRRATASNGEQRRAAPSSVQQDMRRFMHALFQAVKAQAPSGPPDAAVNLPGVQAGEGRPLEMRDKFAAALSSLISQVGAGKAPAELQAAFIQLADDLQPSKATGSTMMPTSSTMPNASAYMSANSPANTPAGTPATTPATTSAGATSGVSKPAVTLHSVLIALQQHVGCARSPSPAEVNTIETTA